MGVEAAAKRRPEHMTEECARPVWQAQNARTAGRLPSVQRRDAARLILSGRVPVEKPEKALFRRNAIPREKRRSAAGRVGGHGERMRVRSGQLLVTAHRGRDERERSRQASRNCLSPSAEAEAKADECLRCWSAVGFDRDRPSIFCVDSAAETRFRRPRRGTKLVAK